MSYFDWGSEPYPSTDSTAVANPSTATLIGELDSTALHAGLYPGSARSSNAQRVFNVTWIVGASTSAIWRLEQCLSTGLDSTAIRDTTFLHSPTGQSGQYMWRMKLTVGDRLRARVNSSFTGLATCKIIAEPLT